MEQEETGTLEYEWAESHPWLSLTVESEEEDTVDEVIRYTLDELRFA